MARRIHLPRWTLTVLKHSRAWERTAERHWALTAMGVYCLVVAAYIIFQLTHIPA